MIGRLQRYAIDPAIATGKSPYARGAPTGKRVAIVGAGPAGLACAHALAVAGVETTIFEPREKAGGLNEYGIAAYKTIDDFAAREVDFILSIGGIEVRHGQALGRDVKLEDLRATTTRCSSASASARPTSSDCRRRPNSKT